MTGCGNIRLLPHDVVTRLTTFARLSSSCRPGIGGCWRPRHCDCCVKRRRFAFSRHFAENRWRYPTVCLDNLEHDVKKVHDHERGAVPTARGFTLTTCSKTSASDSLPQKENVSRDTDCRKKCRKKSRRVRSHDAILHLVGLTDDRAPRPIDARWQVAVAIAQREATRHFFRNVINRDIIRALRYVKHCMIPARLLTFIAHGFFGSRLTF